MPETPASSESFPRVNARTGRFTRGAPRSLHLDRTGDRLLLRAQIGAGGPVAPTTDSEPDTTVPGGHDEPAAKQPDTKVKP